MNWWRRVCWGWLARKDITIYAVIWRMSFILQWRQQTTQPIKLHSSIHKLIHSNWLILVVFYWMRWYYNSTCFIDHIFLKRLYEDYNQLPEVFLLNSYTFWFDGMLSCECVIDSSLFIEEIIIFMKCLFVSWFSKIMKYKEWTFLNKAYPSTNERLDRKSVV